VQTSWIEQQKQEILAKPLDLDVVTASLHTNKTLKRVHYLCGANFLQLHQIPTLPNHPKLSLLQVDITGLEIDAIVNAANEGLLGPSPCGPLSNTLTDDLCPGGGGIDEAVHKAAGPLLQRECATFPLCMTGNAMITKGYKLPASYCIHTVGPYLDDSSKPQPDLLRNCYTNCLELMKQHQLGSIAFPSISTGFYGFPHQWAAEIAVDTVLRWMEGPENQEFVSKRLERVIFAMFNPSSVAWYHKAFAKLKPEPTNDAQSNE